MADYLAEDVIKAARELYVKNTFAQQLFDLNALRLRDANSTSLDLISRKLEISRGDAVALARALEDAKCGEFKVGRRGSKSRFEWAFSCIGLGKAAAGEPIQLERADNPTEEEEEEVSGDVGGLTIANAKAGLAAHLGIAITQIEIIIKA
jgi:hypothetical protein